jgi:hypothetical protein
MTRKAALVPWLLVLALLPGVAGVTAQGPLLPGKSAGYANVVVVAKAGGDFTSIEDAVSSVSAGPDSRWLVWVAPGVYAERVHMKPFVDIAGAGEALVTITAPGSPNYYEAVVAGADDAGLRDVTVENSGGADYAYAIFNRNTSPRIQHVTVSAWAGSVGVAGVFNDADATRLVLEDVTVTVTGTVNSATVYGIYNAYNTSPVMARVRITASGTAKTYGVYNHYYASPEMRDVDVVVAQGGADSAGIFNDSRSSPLLEQVSVRITAPGLAMYRSVSGIYSFGGAPILRHVTVVGTTPGGFAITGIVNVESSPEMTDVSVTVSGGWGYTQAVTNARLASPVIIDATLVVTGSGGIAAAFYNNDHSAPALRQVTAGVTGGTNNYGIYNEYATASIANSAITAAGPVSIGLYASGCGNEAATTVNDSQIAGKLNTVSVATRCTVRVGASQLAGGPVGKGGKVTCVGVYDENYASAGYTVCP